MSSRKASHDPRASAAGALFGALAKEMQRFFARSHRSFGNSKALAVVSAADIGAASEKLFNTTPITIDRRMRST